MCDEMGCVYIAVMEFDERRNVVILNTVYIHQYDHRGTFMKCIFKSRGPIYAPCDLAMYAWGVEGNFLFHFYIHPIIKIANSVNGNNMVLIVI